MTRRLGLALGAACALGAAALAVVYFGRLAHVDGLPVPPLDDTYIHLQYARNLAHGYFFQVRAENRVTVSGGGQYLSFHHFLPQPAK